MGNRHRNYAEHFGNEKDIAYRKKGGIFIVIRNICESSMAIVTIWGDESSKWQGKKVEWNGTFLLLFFLFCAVFSRDNKWSCQGAMWMRNVLLNRHLAEDTLGTTQI